MKIEGTMKIRPSVFSCLDLEKHMRTVRPRVAHMPPIVMNASVNVDSEVTMLVATPPAAMASMANFGPVYTSPPTKTSGCAV